MDGIPFEDVLNDSIFLGNTSAFNELKDFVAQGNITAFTGAGVSVPNYPTWNGLLSTLIDDAVKQGLLSQGEIQEYCDQIAVDPLELARALEDLFSRKVFRAACKDLCESHWNGHRMPAKNRCA
jgi:hypothetical protein